MQRQTTKVNTLPDSVAGGTRNFRDYGHFLPGQPVEQAGLARIGPACKHDHCAFAQQTALAGGVDQMRQPFGQLVKPVRLVYPRRPVNFLFREIQRRFGQRPQFGHLAAELNYVQGQLEGEARYFAQGRLVRRASYRAGQLDGVVEDFGVDGALLQRSRYQANALHGPTLRYWPNGQPMEQIDYANGLLQGSPRQFDQSGKALGAPGPTLINRVEQLLRGTP